MTKQLAFTVIIIIVFSLPIAVHIDLEAQGTDILKRHTPGFPYNSTYTEYLKSVLETLETALNNTSTNRTAVENSIKNLENMSQVSPEYRDYVDSLSYYFNYRDNSTLSSIRKLYEAINSTYLKDLLSSLVESVLREEHVDRETVTSLYKNIADLKNRGVISYEDYVKSSLLLKTIAEIYGYRDLASSIDRDTASMLLNIVERLRNNLENLKFGNLSSPGLVSPIYPLQQLPLRVVLPSYTAPSIAIDRNTLVFILIALASSLMIFVMLKLYKRGFGRGIEMRIPFLKSRKTLYTHIDLDNTAIRSYWEAVKIVEARTGKKKLEWMTHREYSRDVQPYLEKAHSVFDELSKIYEKVRFGGYRDLQHDEKSLELLKKLRESL